MNYSTLRIGSAVDVHGFKSAVLSETARESAREPERCLHLACLEWPGEIPLAGHSDGDAAAHALCDALLIASGIGEMGSIFGTDRPEFAGASGEEFLRETLRLLLAEGYDVINATVQIIAQRPRFAPRKKEAEQRLTSIVGAPISVSATTTDHLGFIGDGEGIAALATALIVRG